ncbi:hypothetical protein FRC04_006329 [Tulasnella sp. 424]|nr:hypothetical protein FRC04_006329 [Tulasnella sp. 424]KAG8980381.1 hypothetical protein FRC05_006012 [Tulasnella sp. 425]
MNTPPTPSIDMGMVPSSSSEGNTAMVDIQEWAAKVKTKLQDTTRLLSSMEEVIRKMDEKVIQDTHTGLISTMGEISKLTDLLGDIELKGKQFSKMTWADMPAIGVKKEVKKVKVDVLRAKLLVERANEDSYRGTANTIAEETRCDMEEWHDSLNYHTEAGARIIINICLQGTLKLARRVSFHHGGPGKPFICPELLISNGADEPEVLADESLDQLTALSGSTDFAIAYSSRWGDLNSATKKLFETSFKDLTGLRADRTSLGVNEDVQRALMTLIEAKRCRSKDKELVDALPQVIAQTIVAGRRSKPHGQTPRSIPFVLANGFEWVFGMLKHSPSSNGEGDWICFTSEAHIIPTEGLKTEAPPESIEATRGAIRVLLDMLLHWICLERDVIMGALDESKRQGGGNNN